MKMRFIMMEHTGLPAIGTSLQRKQHSTAFERIRRRSSQYRECAFDETLAWRIVGYAPRQKLSAVVGGINRVGRVLGDRGRVSVSHL